MEDNNKSYFDSPRSSADKYPVIEKQSFSISRGRQYEYIDDYVIGEEYIDVYNLYEAERAKGGLEGFTLFSRSDFEEMTEEEQTAHLELVEIFDDEMNEYIIENKKLGTFEVCTIQPNYVSFGPDLNYTDYRGIEDLPRYVGEWLAVEFGFAKVKNIYNLEDPCKISVKLPILIEELLNDKKGLDESKADKLMASLQKLQPFDVSSAVRLADGFIDTLVKIEGIPNDLYYLGETICRTLLGKNTYYSMDKNLALSFIDKDKETLGLSQAKKEITQKKGGRKL